MSDLWSSYDFYYIVIPERLAYIPFVEGSNWRPVDLMKFRDWVMDSPRQQLPRTWRLA